jgi:hypothetical protein
MTSPSRKDNPQTMPDKPTDTPDKTPNANPLCTDYDSEGRCNQCGQFDCYECDWGEPDPRYVSDAPPLSKDEQEHADLIALRDMYTARIQRDKDALRHAIEDIEARINASENALLETNQKITALAQLMRLAR